MAKKTAAAEAGEAEVLNDAADKKLAAAKKLAQANALLGDAGDNDESPPEEYHEPEPTKLERILAEIEGEGKIEVSKLIAGTRSRIGIFPISEWPDIMESLARKHGGGEFKVVFKNRRGQICGEDTQTYDPTAYAAIKETPGESSNVMTTRLLEMMEKREQSYLLQIESLRASQNAVMLEMVKTNIQRPQQSSEDFIAMMKFARDMNPPAASPLQQIREVLEVVETLKSEGPIGEPPSPIQVALDRAFTLLNPLLRAWAGRLAAQAVLEPAAPTPGGGGRASLAYPPRPGVAPGVTHVPNSPPAPSLLPALPATPGAGLLPPLAATADPLSLTPDAIPEGIALYAKSLYEAAQGGGNYEAIGDFIITSMNGVEKDLDALYDMVTDPAFVGHLLAAQPGLGQYQAWLANLARYMTDELSFESPEEPGASAGARVDGLDVAENVGDSPAPRSGVAGNGALIA